MTSRTVSKVLIAQEDLALGQGSTSQTRQGASTTVTQIDLPWVLTSTAAISALDTSKYKHTMLDTGTSIRVYRYDTTSAEVADDLTYIDPDEGAGQWVRLAELASVYTTDLLTYLAPFAGAALQTLTNKLSRIVTYEDFGAVGDGVANDTTAVQAAHDSNAKIIDTGDSSKVYLCDDITVPSVKKFIGEGTLKGATPAAKPLLTALAGNSSAANLTALQTYLPSTISFAGSNTFTGELNLENFLLTGGATITVAGTLNTIKCAVHESTLYATKNGLINNDADFISCNAADAAFESRFGGEIVADYNWVVNPVGRGFRAQGSRSLISMIGASTRGTSDEAIFAHVGASVIATSADLQDGATGIGASAIYGGDIALSSATVTGFPGVGVNAESGASVYAQSANISSNGTGVSTSHDGFIQVFAATIQSNTNYGIRNLNGGVVNAFEAVISGNNGGGSNVQVHSEGRGYTYAEEPGVGAGKTALVESSYSPSFNTIGNGLSFIGNYDTGNSFPNDDTGISIERLAISRRVNHDISSGAVTLASTWIIALAETGTADDLETLTRSSANPIDMVIIQPDNGDTITIKHNTGNIYLQGLADIVLDAQNKTVLLIWSKETSKWVQPLI